MTLATHLFDVEMEFACPECGTLKRGTGSYFKSITHYRCPGCKQPVAMTYDRKLKVFARAGNRLSAADAAGSSRPPAVSGANPRPADEVPAGPPRS